jgi:L-ascorbate metabolism protein UlaG (beta-lactamase superfamily)
VDPSSTAIQDERLPRADIVVVTEARFDHLDAMAVRRLSGPGTVVVGPPSVADITHVDVIVGPGTPADVLGVHVSRIGHGYVLSFAGKSVYVSGDTKCPDELSHERGAIDIAFVSVRPPFSMTHSEAASCMESLRPPVVFPYHDRGEDLSDLEKELGGQHIEVRRRNFHPRPEALRLQAVKACREGHYGLCRDFLDRAKPLDPRSEDDPRVIRAREQVRAWQWPFPPWW